MMIRLISGFQIKILNFVYAVFKDLGKTVFDLYQEKDVLQYIEGSRVCKKSIIEKACKIAA